MKCLVVLKKFKWYKLDIKLPDEILKKICIQTNGDVRNAINIVDILNFLYKNKNYWQTSKGSYTTVL